MPNNEKSDVSEEDAKQKSIEVRVEKVMGPPPEKLHTAEEEANDALPSAPPLPPGTEVKPDAEPIVPQSFAEQEKSKQEASEEPADADTDKAIDDIVANEGDEILAAEDEKIAAAFKTDKPTLKTRIKNAISGWWHNKKARYGTFAGLAVALAVLGVVPPTRYFMLNTVGVRASSSVRVLDESTQQPLKNVKVSAAGQSGLTDQDGKVKLEHLKLGSTELVIEKRAFAVVTKKLTIGWGSNPQGDVKLTPTGDQYTFILTDFLSGKGIVKAEATSGEASAFSDENGKLVLTIDKSDENEVQATITAEGYRSEEVTLSVDTTGEQQLKMVAGKKHAFVSKRSGKYDVYAIDADGKNEQKVLAGTGSERDDIALVVHPTDDVAALVSTRDNARNSDGFLLSTLTIIDLKSAEPTKVGQSERVQIVDWIGDRLVYVQIAAGTSGGNPTRHRLISYDYKTGDSKEIAASNYFNDVMVVGSSIYYSPSSAYQTSPKVGLFKVDAEGKGSQTIIDKEVWNIFRVDYDKLNISVGSDWYEHKLGDSKATKLTTAPAIVKTRLYTDSQDKKHSLWIDERDGRGVLLNYDVEAKTEATLRTQSGLSNPVRWLNNATAVYRISTQQETADYVISIDGGDPKKIKDVTNTGGVEAWYYY